MKPVKSHRELKDGLFISVRNLKGKVIFRGQVIGFPYRSERFAKSQHAAPDMVLLRVQQKEQEVFLRQLGIGANASTERQTFIVEP